MTLREFLTRYDSLSDKQLTFTKRADTIHNTSSVIFIDILSMNKYGRINLNDISIGISYDELDNEIIYFFTIYDFFPKIEIINYMKSCIDTMNRNDKIVEFLK